jgi:glycosyltransferase involved in cell wall biosynthesis
VEVGFDGRSFLAGRGVARYTRRLAASLASRHPADGWHAFVPGNGHVDAPDPRVVLHRDPRPQRLLFASAALVGRPRLDGLLGRPVDVLWIPAPAPVAVSPDVPYVLTVHDLSFERRPGDFTPYERLWHRLARPRRLGRRAARIVCVSEAVAAEVRAQWPVDPARVSVVLNGVDRPAATAKTPHPDRSLPERYLLWVGALEPRKAPEVLGRAFAAARARGLDADLVVAGEGRLSGAIAGPGVHLLGAVGDARLGELYAHALALVMPSWLEGFGLPPLEAAAHGVPSVVSDLPVFRETLGAGALRVAPGDAEALADALLRIAREPALRGELAAAAAARIAPLTWERAADALHDALSAAAAEGSPARAGRTRALRGARGRGGR